MLSKQALNNVLDIAKLGPVFTLEISQLHHLVTLMNTEIININNQVDDETCPVYCCYGSIKN